MTACSDNGASGSAASQPLTASSAAHGGVRQCRWADFSFTIEALPPAQPREHRLSLVFSKDSGARDACVMNGFPAVELIGPVHPPESRAAIFSVPTPVVPTDDVLVSPGDAAHAVLTY